MTPEELLKLAQQLDQPWRVREQLTSKIMELAQGYVKLHADHAALSVKLEEATEFQRVRDAHADEVIDARNQQLSELAVKLEAANRQWRDFEEREGACCPEDVGFDEYIKVLRVQLEAAEQERDEWQAKHQDVERRYLFNIAQMLHEPDSGQIEPEASRGEVVKACPQCWQFTDDQGLGVSQIAGGWACSSCGATFTEPAYWQRVNSGSETRETE